MATTSAAATTHRYRTSDVSSDASSFDDLLLPKPLVQALAAAGFQRPSPVQQLAIPLGLVGTDLIVQAKSGTGKTCVFAVIALQRVQLDVSTPQVREGRVVRSRARRAAPTPCHPSTSSLLTTPLHSTPSSLYNCKHDNGQVLILAPTREVALQISDVIQRVAAGLPAPAPVCVSFVGGLPTSEDEKRLRR